MGTAVQALIAIALLLSACHKPPPVKSSQDTGPVQVQVASVTTRQLQRVVESVGTLFPFDEVIVSAEIEGRVDKVNFDLGDSVVPGDVLVGIDDQEQRYILLQNEAQMRQSLERLGLKGENEKVRDIEETPEVRRARADLTEAQKRYERARVLVEQRIGAQVDLDAASSRLQAMQAGLDITRHQTRNLTQEVERFKAVVELQRKKLRDTTVRAPFAGQVKERQVTVGQYVRPNTPLFTLVKINPVRLRLEVPERLAPWTNVGQTAEVSVEAFENRHFIGRVSRIAPMVDQSKRTFIVEALIDNPKGELKPGSYARAKLATRRMDQVRLVPVRAVNYVLGTNKAYVVRDNGIIEAREIKVGERYDQELEVIEGLAQGEIVATTELNKLDTGVAVKAVAGKAQKAE